MNLNIFGKEIFIKKIFAVICVIVLAFILGYVGFVINQKSKSEKQITFEKVKAESTGASSSIIATTVQSAEILPPYEKESKPKDEIKVYVTGSVNNPGIVSIEKNQLINDAVEKAGGFTSDADKNNINLVYPLNENVMLYIKSKAESKASNAGGNAGKGVVIVNDSAGSVINSPVTKTDAKQKVNINTATEDELDTLPGIGKGTAKDIIAYRQKKPFKAIKDICQVPGIKDNKFNKFKDFITVE